MLNLQAPLAIMQWVMENKKFLTPPVSNKILYPCEDFIIMIVGGPNNRLDYHVNPTQEFFFQLTGDIVLRTQQKKVDGDAQGSFEIVDIPIKEGEIFLLDAHIPHSPQRFENTVGLVIERKRMVHQLDQFVWFCPVCNKLTHQESVKVNDIEKDLPNLFDKVYQKFPSKDFTCLACQNLK